MTLPNSSHYEWHQLNDGILAAVMKPDGNSRADSNIVCDFSLIGCLPEQKNRYPFIH